MFVHAIKIASASMFPIFRAVQINPNQANIGVVGTGFFVSSNGIFVSVAHAFDDATPQTRYFFAGRLPGEIANPQLDIEEVARIDDHDVYIGRVKKKTKPLILSKKVPDIGRTVCISGYPLATLASNPAGGLNVSGVRRYFQPSFVLDRIQASLPATPSGLIRVHDGFLIRDFGLFGMSGGPVFDTSGTVLGMQAAVTNPRVSTNGTRTITVENAVAVRSDIILDFMRQRRIRLD